MATPLSFRGGYGEVCLRGVDLGGVGKAVIEQRVVDGANPTADIEEGRLGREGAVLHRSEELLGSGIGAVPVERRRSR